MEANQFRIGNLVLHRDIVSRIYGIVEKPNSSTFDIFLAADGELFHVNPNDVNVIPLSEEILEKFFGFEETKRHPHRLLFNQDTDAEFNVDVYRSRFDNSNWVVFISQEEYFAINTVHEFQNLLYVVLRKELAVVYDF